MIWTEGLDILKIFIDYLNNIHSTIKLTSSHSSTNIPFLDVSVSLTNDGSIYADLYTKPTEKHQRLLYSSCHPMHTKKAIPFSRALRLRRICSTDTTSGWGGGGGGGQKTRIGPGTFLFQNHPTKSDVTSDERLS